MYSDINVDVVIVEKSIIFQRTSMPKIKCLLGIVVNVHENGCKMITLLKYNVIKLVLPRE